MVGKGNILDVMYVDISKVFVSYIKIVVLELKNVDYVNLCNNENFWCFVRGFCFWLWYIIYFFNEYFVGKMIKFEEFLGLE